MDTSYGVLPDTSKDTLKNILTEDEYNAITNTRVEYRCKYLTFLNRLFAEKKVKACIWFYGCEADYLK